MDDYRPLVYTAIGLALVSFTLSFFEKDKGDGRGPEEDDSTVLEEDDSTGPEVDH
ncbi:MAG TPA: hypothetical protein VFD33_08350 [Bacillota bacterium]|nr:hypothetical protein [Bacillota bacterium]